MTKKFLIIAGVIAVAALAAAGVAIMLLNKKEVIDCLDCEEEDELYGI